MWFDVSMRLPPLELRRDDRATLESWARGNDRSAHGSACSHRAAGRRWHVNRAIADVVGLHYNQVGLWRSRYGEFGLAGLDDGERSGRPPVYNHDDVLLLVKTVTEPPPDGATRWTMEALAEAMAGNGVAISASQVWRICKALD